MEAALEAVTRQTFGKNETRRLRRGGRIPAIVYGGGGKDGGGTAVSIDPKLLMQIMTRTKFMKNLLIREGKNLFIYRNLSRKRKTVAESEWKL